MKNNFILWIVPDCRLRYGFGSFAEHWLYVFSLRNHSGRNF